MSRVFADGIDGIDRLPQHLPLADGWDWYWFSDGQFSSRWISSRPPLSPAKYPEGTIHRCTHCGRETESVYVIRRHNGLITSRQRLIA